MSDEEAGTVPIGELSCEPDPLARTWRSRARGEARVGRTFARLADAFGDDEVLPEVRARLRDAAREEAEHARLCEAMASAYGGAPVVDRPAVDAPLPLETPLTRHLLLVSACCISESIASAYLERCLAEARDPRARDALHDLLRDEIGHAQLGWAHLASLAEGSPLRAALLPSLPGVVARTRRAWHERLAVLHARAAPEHGYPPADRCLAVVDEAVEHLVLRGFRHVGLEL